LYMAIARSFPMTIRIVIARMTTALEPACSSIPAGGKRKQTLDFEIECDLAITT
jgi:hypothetical protein